MNRRLAAPVVIAVSLWLAGPPGAHPAAMPDPVLERIDSPLRELIAAERQGQGAVHARRHGLRVAPGPDGLQVEVVIETAAEAVFETQALEALGARLGQRHSSRVVAWLPVRGLTQVAGLPRVLGLRRPWRPTWDVTSQGVNVTGAAVMHQSGITGQDVRIGVIDSFQDFRSKLGNELPPQDRVTFRSFADGGSEGEDRHGVQVAEIITDMAPGARLYLAAIDDDVGFSNAVDFFIAEGVRIVNHSGGFGLLGDMKGRGPIHGPVERAFAANILYVESAGNYGDAHWAGRFTDSNRNGSHEFAPGVERLPFHADSDDEIRIDLTWDDWVPDPADPRPTTDYDLCLYDAAGNELACARDAQTGRAGQIPYEILLHTPGGAGDFSIGIRKDAGANVDLELGLIPGYPLGPFNVAESSLIAPADSSSVFTVGAVALNDIIRNYSSRGPTNDGRLKPEITAPDGVNTSLGNFFGTSAAAPHVAGAAALLLQLDGSLGASSLGDRIEAIAVQSQADPVSGPDSTYGFGRLNANFTGASTPPPTPFPSLTPQPSASVRGGGGCRLLGPEEPAARLQLLVVVLVVAAYGAWMSRRG